MKTSSPSDRQSDPLNLTTFSEAVQILSDAETGFSCPNCQSSPLQVANLFGTQVCYCDRCGGFVIDRATLGDLIQALRSEYDGVDDKPTPINHRELGVVTRCPACFDRMATFSYCGPGNVVLDTCEGCRLTWFNEGELMKIIRAPGKRSGRR